MIYYFSGTGNTRLAAEKLAGELNIKADFISGAVTEEDLSGDSDLVLMFPVYAWGVPPAMLDFAQRIPQQICEKILRGEIRLWCVATCGDETGMAVEMLRDVLRKKGIDLSGAWSVTAPNVYVLLPGFDVDPQNVELEKLHDITPRMAEIARKIKSFKNGDHPIEDVFRGSWPKLKTRIVYPLFKRWGINPRKWRWNKECISCGRCAAVCPRKNIEMIGGHPKWGKDCVSCLACYHVCPRHAVEYGNMTVGKGQYSRLLK